MESDDDVTWDPDLLALNGEINSANGNAQQAAVKRIIKRCRKSPASLADYCRMGILDVVPAALQRSVEKEPQWKAASNSSVQLLELALTLSRLHFEGHKAPKAKGTKPLVHYGVSCDECHQSPLRGKRLNALDRYDYDLCETCFMQRPEEERARFKELEPVHQRQVADFDVGDVVQARSREGRYYEGTITQDHGDGTYLLEWSDGDAPTRMDADQMRTGVGELYGLGRRMRHGVPPPEALSGILLRSALPENDINLARMVLGDGADVNHTDEQGNSPLLYAISNGMSEELVQLLIDAGADVNMSGPEGSALQVAAANDRIELAETLLGQDADASEVDLSVCSEAMVALLQQHSGEGSAGEAAAAGGSQAANAKDKKKAVQTTNGTESKAAASEPSKELTAEALESYKADCVSKLLPALLLVHHDSQHALPRRRALVAMAYMFEHGPPDVIKSLPSPIVFSTLSLLERLFATDALATALLALRLVQGLLRNAPSLCSELKRYGAFQMVENLSKTSYIKARGLRSESGNTRPCDVSELATAVSSLFQQQLASHATPAQDSGLAVVTKQLRNGDVAAVRQLCELLEKEGGMTAHEMAEHAVPAAVVTFIKKFSRNNSCSALIESFTDSNDGMVATPRTGLKTLLSLLHNMVATNEQLPVYSRGSTRSGHGLRTLTEPIKLCLRSVASLEAELAKSESVSTAMDDESEDDGIGQAGEKEDDASDDEAADGVNESAASRARGVAEALVAEVQGGAGGAGFDPIAAAVAAAVRAAAMDNAGGSGSSGDLGRSAQGGTPLSLPDDPSVVLARIEPLVQMRQLENHVLRCCPNEEQQYFAYCEQLVGSVIEERAVPENETEQRAEYRTALVIKFEKHPLTSLPIHHLRYNDGRVRQCVLALRDYYTVSEGNPTGAEAAPPPDVEMGMQEADDPEARIHTVSIMCPEGFPVDMFLDSVRPAVKRSLSQEDPGHAPMNRPPGAQYQWPDRGWKRESEFNEVSEAGLSDTGTGTIARGQTLHEAEVLVNRLADVVVATISVDRSKDYTTANQPARQQESLTKGVRIHALMTGGDWTPATVLCSEGDRSGVIYDDGTWEEGVRRSSIRPTGQAERRRRPLLPGDAASFSEFLRRHLGGGPAMMMGSGAETALSDTAGHITRTFPAFETGSVNRTGHVDLDAETVVANQEMAPPAPTGVRPSVAFALEAYSTGSSKDKQKPSKKPKLEPTVLAPKLLSPDITLLEALQKLTDERYPTSAQPAPPNATYTLTYKITYGVATPQLKGKEAPLSGRPVTPEALERCGLGQTQVSYAVILLSILHEHFSAYKGMNHLWASHKLTQKMSHQLEDPLSVASGAMPEWCNQLCSLTPFLFSLNARRSQLESTGFGVSHSVHWVQEQVAEVRRARLTERRTQAERAAAEAEESGDVEAVAEAADRLAEVDDEIGRDRIGQLKSDIAKVNREGILETAQKLMHLHAPSRAILEVQFEGEDGFGKGVTQNFYCSVAGDLQLRSENVAVKMWVPDESGTEGHLHCPYGLFPHPHLDGEMKVQVCKRFKFLGQLLAKACRDGFIVPLPLSDTLFALALGESPAPHMLPPPGATGGVVSAYAAVCSRMQTIQNNPFLSSSECAKQRDAVIGAEFARQYLGVDYDMSIAEYLRAADVCFVDPLSGMSLCENGEQRSVTVDCLQEYVGLIVEAWLGKSVSSQVAALREGISEVFPFEDLAKFNSSELKYMFCGNNTIEWDSATLEQNLHPTANLTRDADLFKILVEQLLEMSNQERSDFLNFVTACPRLPPGGLGALGIEITTQRTKSMIPTSQTCVPKLYLPEYPDGASLRAGMLEAFKNAETGGFHENGGRFT